MENRKKNRLSKLRVTSVALASMVLMGSGIGKAQAMISRDMGSIKKTTQNSLTVNNDSEITSEEQQKINESKITDEWDKISLQAVINGSGDLLVYEFLFDRKLTKSIMYLDSKNDEYRILGELFSGELLFKHKRGEEIIDGVGEFEGRIEFVAWYELSQYFEEVEKRSINLDEIKTLGDLRKIIMDTPSLIDDYVDMSKLQLKDNNETKLVYCPDGYMKLEEDSLKTYVKTKRS